MRDARGDAPYGDHFFRLDHHFLHLLVFRYVDHAGYAVIVQKVIIDEHDVLRAILGGHTALVCLRLGQGILEITGLPRFQYRLSVVGIGIRFTPPVIHGWKVFHGIAEHLGECLIHGDETAIVQGRAKRNRCQIEKSAETRLALNGLIAQDALLSQKVQQPNDEQPLQDDEGHGREQVKPVTMPPRFRLIYDVDVSRNLDGLGIYAPAFHHPVIKGYGIDFFLNHGDGSGLLPGPDAQGELRGGLALIKPAVDPPSQNSQAKIHAPVHQHRTGGILRDKGHDAFGIQGMAVFVLKKIRMIH